MYLDVSHFWFLFPYRSLEKVDQSLWCWTVGPCDYFIWASGDLSVPNSSFIPPASFFLQKPLVFVVGGGGGGFFPLGLDFGFSGQRIHLLPFSMACLSDITGYFITLGLRSFTKYDQSQVHPCCCRRQSFISLFGWVRVHHIQVPHLSAACVSPWAFLLLAGLGDCSLFCSNYRLHPRFGNPDLSLHIVSGVSFPDLLVEIDLYFYLLSLAEATFLQAFLHRGSCTLPSADDHRMGPFPPGPIPLWFSVPVFSDLFSDSCEVISGWDFDLPLPTDCFSCT